MVIFYYTLLIYYRDIYIYNLFLGLMVENISEDGKMGNSMVKVYSLLQMVKRKKESGKMDKEKDG